MENAHDGIVRGWAVLANGVITNASISFTAIDPRWSLMSSPNVGWKVNFQVKLPSWETHNSCGPKQESEMRNSGTQQTGWEYETFVWSRPRRLDNSQPAWMERYRCDPDVLFLLRQALMNFKHSGFIASSHAFHSYDYTAGPPALWDPVVWLSPSAALSHKLSVWNFALKLFTLIPVWTLINNKPLIKRALLQLLICFILFYFQSKIAALILRRLGYKI